MEIKKRKYLNHIKKYYYGENEKRILLEKWVDRQTFYMEVYTF